MEIRVKFILELAMKAQRGVRGIAQLFNLGFTLGWVVNATPRPLHPSERDLVSILHEAGWAPGRLWTGAENLATPPGFDPRTVQSVASRRTDYDIPTQNKW